METTMNMMTMIFKLKMLLKVKRKKKKVMKILIMNTMKKKNIFQEGKRFEDKDAKKQRKEEAKEAKREKDKTK